MMYRFSSCSGGGHSFFNYYIHVRSGFVYRGAIYLGKKFIRYGIFKIRVNEYILIHPISNYDFLGESF